MTFDFSHKLQVSKGIVRATCTETIQAMIDGCVRVEANEDTELDKNGVDYVAWLRRGCPVYIDHKAREPGCSKFWQQSLTGPVPEFALETFSVIPTRVGWTLDESKITDYTLHTFDPADSRECWLLPFQLLRIAFRRCVTQWKIDFRVARQQSTNGNSSWQSECVFVPSNVVVNAINVAMQGWQVQRQEATP